MNGAWAGWRTHSRSTSCQSKRPRWPKMRLRPLSCHSRVVVGAHVAVVAPVGAEAGERARGLADVALAVAAAERVELHQLAGVVLVRRLGVRVGQRQVQKHGRVARDLAQEVGEGTERVAAQGAVLGQHQRRVLLAGGEVVVPEERELLLQRARRAHHLVEPPDRVVAPRVHGVELLAVLELRRRDAGQGRRAAVHQPADRGGLAAPRPVARFARRGAEAGSPEQPPDVGLGPRLPASMPSSGSP